MRLTELALGLSALSALALSAAPAAAAKPTAQATHCAQQATKEGLKGAARTDFLKSCQKGPLAPTTPTAPTAATKEGQAVTKPSGVDRTTRAKDCAAEADKRKLASKARQNFQLSCLASAGPVSESQAGTQQPKPARSIDGIGVNNNKPTATTAKSKSEPNPPAAAKPKS